MEQQFKCQHCGNERYFYNEVSVQAKMIIDNKRKTLHDKVVEAEMDKVDNFFPEVYCNDCDESLDVDVVEE